MKKFKEIWEYVKTHKKQILITAGVLALGVVVEETRWNAKTKNMIEVVDPKDLGPGYIPDLIKPEPLVGDITDYWNEGQQPHTIIKNLKVSDLGLAATQFVGSNGITDNTNAEVVIGFITK